MKHSLSLLIFLLVACPNSVRAADTLLDAAALAAQRDAEERFKRMAADIQTIQDTQEVLLKRQEEFRQRLEKLADEIRSFKDDQSRSSGNFATRDELRKFVEKLKEVDDKRESDKKVILENIKELAKIPVAPPPESKPPRRASESNQEPPYLYVVKKNDRLLDIIADYNEYFQKNGQPKITMEQVLKANPGLKPDRLFAGKKIRIPVPSKDSK